MVMNAAKQIRNNQVSDNPKNPQYEYISEVLEVRKNIPSGFMRLLNPSLHLIDSKSVRIMCDYRINKWKWKVGSLKALMNPSNASSLQEVRENVENYLK